MFQYILTLILMLSLGAVLYLVARSLPRVSAEEGKEDKRGLVERWVTSEIPEKADELLNSFLFKLFKRVKLVLLKVDNILGKRIEKVRPANGKGEQGAGLHPAEPLQTNFQDLSETKKEKKK